MLFRSKLYVKRSKCSFAQKSIEYLGHVITEKGVATDRNKIAAIEQWPTPKNVKQVRGFLGLAGYYRRFIRNFGPISKPLTQLLKKGTIFVWTDAADTAFHVLKQALLTAPVLALPDYKTPFVVETDACDVG